MSIMTPISRVSFHPMSRSVRVLVFIGLIAVLGIPLDARGETAAQVATLSEADKADIARIEDYLNRIDTLKARFVQMASTGDMSRGEFYISRPGKLRIAYDPPVPVLIVANGTFLIYHDTELDQTSHLLLSSTPASVLVEENVRLNSDTMSVTKIDHGANAIRVTLKQIDDPAAGLITLTFTDQPLSLRQWTVLDAQGTTTDFALVDPRFGLTLDPALFEFIEKPRFNQRDN